MAKKMMNWTFNDVISFLKEKGFYHHHTKASHHFYRGIYDGKPRQVHIQFHGQKAIKPRTLKSAITQSGIPQGEWFKD